MLSVISSGFSLLSINFVHKLEPLLRCCRDLCLAWYGSPSGTTINRMQFWTHCACHLRRIKRMTRWYVIMSVAKFDYKAWNRCLRPVVHVSSCSVTWLWCMHACTALLCGNQWCKGTPIHFSMTFKVKEHFLFWPWSVMCDHAVDQMAECHLFWEPKVLVRFSF